MVRCQLAHARLAGLATGRAHRMAAQRRRRASRAIGHPCASGDRRLASAVHASYSVRLVLLLVRVSGSSWIGQPFYADGPPAATAQQQQRPSRRVPMKTLQQVSHAKRDNAAPQAATEAPAAPLAGGDPHSPAGAR